jgi:hypothetical protein
MMHRPKNTWGGNNEDAMQLQPHMTAEIRPKRIEFDFLFEHFKAETNARMHLQ